MVGQLVAHSGWPVADHEPIPTGRRGLVVVNSKQKRLVFQKCAAFLFVASTEITGKDGESISVVRFAWNQKPGAIDVETGLSLALSHAGLIEVGKLCLAEMGVIVRPKLSPDYYFMEIIRLLDYISSACLSKWILDELERAPTLNQIQIPRRGAA
jgi:hypothetical protein